MEYIGKLGGYEVYRADPTEHYDGTSIEVIDPNVVRGKRQPTYKRVMEIELAQLYSKNAWHVNISRVDKKYQGEGLSFRIYRFLLSKIPGFILQAGTSQSPGGAYIWYKLSQFKDVIIIYFL